MSIVDSLNIHGVGYEISPSSTGTLKNFSSGDAASPSSWTNVDTITAKENNSVIFSKITTMIKNVRFIYNTIGTTDFSTAGTTISSAIKNLSDSKSPINHTHTTSNLPISNAQINSSAYIPTSSLVYSMNEQIKSLDSARTDYGTEDLIPGESYLATGKIYCFYE